MHYVIDSLVQRGADSWRASLHPVFDDGARGERVFHTIRARNRRIAKREAEELRSSLEDVQREEASTPTDAPTLLEWQSEWADQLQATGSIRGRTAQTYRDSIRLSGPIANKRITEITTEDVIDAVQLMLEGGISPNTAASRVGAIRSSLERARDEGWIDKNPARRVKPPKRVETKGRALTKAERERLMATLPSLDGYLPIAVTMALSAGVRREEACGLQYRDLNTESGMLSIERAVVRDEFGGICVKEPKTASSRRKLPAANALLDAVSKRKTWHERRCRAAGMKFKDTFFILGDIDGEPPDPNRLQTDFKALCGSIGLDCTYHWLRHTFATMLLANKVDVATVARWLGHSDPGFTLRVYCSPDDEAFFRSLDTVNRFFDTN